MLVWKLIVSCVSKCSGLGRGFWTMSGIAVNPVVNGTLNLNLIFPRSRLMDLMQIAWNSIAFCTPKAPGGTRQPLLVYSCVGPWSLLMCWQVAGTTPRAEDITSWYSLLRACQSLHLRAHLELYALCNSTEEDIYIYIYIYILYIYIYIYIFVYVYVPIGSLLAPIGLLQANHIECKAGT